MHHFETFANKNKDNILDTRTIYHCLKCPKEKQMIKRLQWDEDLSARKKTK